MTPIIFLDIETVPDQREGAADAARARIKVPKQYKKPEAIEKYIAENTEEAYHATGLNGGYGEMFCVSFAVDGSDVLTVKRSDPWRESMAEAVLLETLNIALPGSLGPAGSKRRLLFVGHNIEFDLRFLFHRYVVNQIKPAFALPYNDAPWKGSYFCTEYAWVGAKKKIGCKELSMILGMPAGNDIEGSEVWGCVQRGELEAVIAHCEADVERVRHIYRRLTFSGSPHTAGT